MTSLEFQLARAFTAQSKWADPKIIRGGKVELTADDIRAAVSMATGRYTFHAMVAKYCNDPHSEAVLLDWVEIQSWLRLGERYPKTDFKREVNVKLAELAVLFFLNPTQGLARGDAGNASYIGCHRNTWITKYRNHFKELTAMLLDLERRARHDVRKILRRD